MAGSPTEVGEKSDVVISIVTSAPQVKDLSSQALEGMPGGPWKADAPGVVLPDREKMKTQMEALIYHFKIVT